jgi:septal ring factor EnvC (AmiA/AmiB activator)
MNHLKKLCYHHNNPLKIYCESCEEPICQECHMIGPHNTKLHRVSNIMDIFKKKYNYLNNIINKNLIDKLDQLNNQIQRVDNVIDKVKNTKNEIERNIRSEYAEMIENLRSEEGKKLAVLQYETANLQKDVNKIEDIINLVNDIGESESPDMIAFLLQYKNLNELLEQCLAKPFKSIYYLFILSYRKY